MQGEGLKKLQSGQPISTRELLLLIAQLSWPAILAQISSVVMQYPPLSVWWRPPRGSSAICALR